MTSPLGSPSPLTIANWNLEWASQRKVSYPLIQNHLNGNIDVACFTEVNIGSIPHAGEHLITADADYGYKAPATRRKVVLSSKSPWTEVDAQGSAALPGGRFISGVTEGIRFVGVCIPWYNAHVTTGRKDATRWNEHLDYLTELKAVLQRYSDAPEPICILGDYNQRIPRVRQPEEAYQALCETLADYTIHTRDHLDPEGKPLIDHLASSPALTFTIDKSLPAKDQDVKLSDHTGYIGALTRI